MTLRCRLVLCASLALLAVSAATARAGQKLVMAHYMPWFVSQPFSGSWGWHWTMNHFNPNVVNPTNGQDEIASWYYPAIGPYDSADPAVDEYHVLLMKLAGIDGAIVDWYGMDNFNDYGINNQRTIDLFNEARKAGLKFSLCYEDATIQQEINGGFITASGAIAHAQQTMLYVQTNFMADPCYLRRSGAPVLLNFGPQYFLYSSNWVSILSVLDATNQPVFFTENNRLSPVGFGAFDWPPMQLAVTNANSTNEPILSDATLNSYLDSFEQSGKTWPAYISSAFPRFHDIYAQANVEPSFGFLSDQSGQTFQETLSRAMTNSSAYVQVVTWNDFGEGTIVEPTTEYLYRDLGVIQNFRRQYLDPSFPFTTNDLPLALRLYTLRKQYGGADAVVTEELDRAFTNIVNGDITAADLELSALESGRPVIYNVSAMGSQLQFYIGGYISNTGIAVQSSPTLAATNWQTIATYSGGPNAPVFSTSIPAKGTPTFFRLKNEGP